MQRRLNPLGAVPVAESPRICGPDASIKARPAALPLLQHWLWTLLPGHCQAFQDHMMDTESPIATRDELISHPEMRRPHLVILGAGASVAACPEGDRNGRRLPTMENLVEILGLGTLLAKNGITDARQNFEALYSSLYSDRSQSGLTSKIETAVRDYFSSLELPDRPTIYDHLLLSLRRKDAVFTFNWDPFLFDAWVRNQRFGLPEIFFLHGNVRVGYCSSHPTCWGAQSVHCPECRARFGPTKLLYPVKNKNYVSDQFVASAWDAAKSFLENAFTLTIFGYGAPDSDTEAVELMRKPWNRADQKLVERVEIIDLKSRDALYETWKPFISHHHYDCRPCFYQSFIANYPRRSTEALYAPSIHGRAAEQFPIPRQSSFDELYAWLEPIAKYETEKAAHQNNGKEA
jgi:hypothetical protein